MLAIDVNDDAGRLNERITPVGASLLAMDVNDYAGRLDERVAQTFFASRLAPTGSTRAFVGAMLARDRRKR